MKYALILVALASLSGCFATIPAAPVIPKTVEVPVPVQCKTPNPTPPTLHFNPPYTTVFNGTKDLIGDREQMTAYQTQLLAALNSCK